MKIKKNDIVKIMTGKDKGKTGKILNILLKENKVLIEGLNLYKKNIKPKKQGEKGQIISMPRPIDVSNIMIMCQSCGSSARVGFRFEDENKIRYCKKCKAKI
ncbi:MAG: 50S ribosomal protein L24 [Patescibacteria group bacterium]